MHFLFCVTEYTINIILSARSSCKNLILYAYRYAIPVRVSYAYGVKLLRVRVSRTRTINLIVKFCKPDCNPEYDPTPSSLANSQCVVDRVSRKNDFCLSTIDCGPHPWRAQPRRGSTHPSLGGGYLRVLRMRAWRDAGCPPSARARALMTLATSGSLRRHLRRHRLSSPRPGLVAARRWEPRWRSPRAC